MATNGVFAQQEQYKAADPAIAPASAPAADGNGTSDNNPSKDQVGWYFVEQYYTTLSKSPEKLHLFYGKRSQFVYGKEAEVANVSVGRQAIQERIKELDFQDCKVRVSNVDSQASGEAIVIQVIGETSNKSGEPKKFVQTFILAQQPSGYFVLNDILRYVDEGEESTNENTPETDNVIFEASPAPEPEPAQDEPLKQEDTEIKTDEVDKKLAEIPTEEASVNGGTETAVEAPTEQETTATSDSETVTKDLIEEESAEPEQPSEPQPTPALAPVTDAPAVQTPASSGPPKPMTWASRAAAAAGPKPALPLARTATPTTQKPAATVAAPAAATSTTTTSPATNTNTTSVPPAVAPTPVPATTDASSKPATQAASGWQTAGAESKRHNRPQSISGPIEKEGTMGYVKYVTEKVQEADLKAALAAHGELIYFDINCQKNCAFVEFKTLEGYQAAVTANPHVVNGENIVVEPRRPKSNTFGGAGYTSGRGGGTGRGRGGFDNNRNSGGQGNRNSFGGQNRGRAGGAPRTGRGGTQQAA